MAERRTGSRTASVLDAMSYGPVGYLQALSVGFIAGCVVFLIWDSCLREHDVVTELPVLLGLAALAAAAALIGGMVVNYASGRRVRDEIEFQRSIFARGAVPLPPARRAASAIDLSTSQTGKAPDPSQSHPPTPQFNKSEITMKRDRETISKKPWQKPEMRKLNLAEHEIADLFGDVPDVQPVRRRASA